MPRKTQVEVVNNSVATEVATVALPKEEKKTKKSRVKTQPSVSAVSTLSTVAETGSTVTGSSKTRAKRVHTVESIDVEFEALVKLIDDEINRLKESSQKTKGVRFLKTTRKRISVIREHNKRVSRRKQTEKRKNNNSGFLKPVQVSNELADFVGWNHGELHTRVEATKALCQYIKKNNLQSQENKRNIVPDDRLRKLLNYSDDPNTPFTYYNMQKYMTRHFPPSLAKRKAMASSMENASSTSLPVSVSASAVSTTSASSSAQPASSSKKGRQRA